MHDPMEHQSRQTGCQHTKAVFRRSAAALFRPGRVHALNPAQGEHMDGFLPPALHLH